MRALLLLSTLPLVTVSAPVVAQSSGPQLAAAQRAAWGRAGSTTYRLDKENVRFTGGQIVQGPAGPILVAEGRVVNFSHVSAGRIGAFYLQRGSQGFRRGAAYPSAVTGGSHGRLAEWGISRRFGPNPVIYAEGGFTGQGLTCVTTTLTELTPRGPVELAAIPTGYEAPDGRSITGRITRVVPGRSITVAYTGSMQFTDTWLRRGATYRLAGRSRYPGC